MIKAADWVVLLAIPTLLLMLGTNPVLPYTKDVPGCFPDYRPGFKCLIWEKLP
jgi:hypothetical protein